MTILSNPQSQGEANSPVILSTTIAAAEEIALIIVTETGFNLASDHGVDEEAGQRALDLALIAPYFKGMKRAAVDTGTLLGPAAVTVPGVTGTSRDQPSWCTVEKIDRIEPGDPEFGEEPEIWIEVHTGNVPVMVEMTDGESEPRYLVPVPVSSLIPSTSRFHKGKVVALLCKSGEKLAKRSKRGADYQKGLAKQDKQAAKESAGAKRARAVVVREDTIEIEGEDVPCFRLMPQSISGKKLPLGWKEGLPNGGVFWGPQAKAKAEATRDMVIDRLG